MKFLTLIFLASCTISETIPEQTVNSCPMRKKLCAVKDMFKQKASLAKEYLKNTYASIFKKFKKATEEEKIMEVPEVNEDFKQNFEELMKNIKAQLEQMKLGQNNDENFSLSASEEKEDSHEEEKEDNHKEEKKPEEVL